MCEMAKFKVNQIVMCEVRVWYVVDAPTHSEALDMVAKKRCPTSEAGADYEITSDTAITYTKVEADDGH
jgi:hypothetical protein